MEKMLPGRSASPVLIGLVLWLSAARATSEVLYLKNGDVIHGSVVGATENGVTLETPYGRLVIPKRDILQIDYQGEEKGQPSLPEESDRKAVDKRSVSPAGADCGPPGADRGPPGADRGPPGADRGPPGADRGPPTTGVSGPQISLEIRGQSFWYAFHSPPEDPADLSIRLRLFGGEVEVVRFLDSKPDTVDGDTFYNSFTFSPTDSRILRTADGYVSNLQEAEDGRVVVNLGLPEDHPEGPLTLRMLYQVNEGSEHLPYWTDAVARSFTIQVKAGKNSYVVIEQDAAGLDYSGFFRKTMRNLESFRLYVLNAGLREPER